MAGTILIYDGIAANRIILRCKLSSACYDVVQAESYEDLVLKAMARAPDLVICDLDQSSKHALALCRKLSSAAAAHPVPVLLLATTPSPALRIAAVQAGAWNVMPKPFHDDLLFAWLRQILRQSHRLAESRIRQTSADDMCLSEAPAPYAVTRNCIALVAEAPDCAEAWKDRLAPRIGATVLHTLSPDQALSRSDHETAPDAFVIFASKHDWQRTLRLISELHSRIATQHSRVILVMNDASKDTSCLDAETATRVAMALDLGAHDVVHGRFHLSELALRLETQTARKRITDNLRRALQNSLELASRDPLTGLYNRRYAMPRLDRMLHLSRDNRQPLALMALDLDRFKSVNDTHGHAAGDAVLVEVARRLAEALRPRDLLARSGGEEFWIALPNTDPDTAAATAQSLRQLIRSNPITLPDRRGLIRVTISIGVSAHHPSGTADVPSIEHALARADTALYAAKANGRDKVNFASCAA